MFTCHTTSGLKIDYNVIKYREKKVNKLGVKYNWGKSYQIEKNWIE